MKRLWLILAFVFAAATIALSRPTTPLAEAARIADEDGPVGIFEKHEDVGNVLHPGSVAFDKDSGCYTIAGSGDNMWAAKDALHFLWKKASGDVALAADISFVGEGKDPHRKACLL